MTIDPQTSFDEQVVDDVELERLLEEREVLKESAGGARKAFDAATEEVKERAARLELEDGPVRVGRFVLGYRQREARSVAFETEPSRQLVIRVDRAEP